MSWRDELEPTPWQVGDELPRHNDDCMVCGPSSAAHALLEPFRVVDHDTVGTRVRFDERHQGAPRYAHGGMVAAVLDDACGYVGFLVLRVFVTAHLEVDYRRPVVLGTQYEVRARCADIDGRKVQLTAELLDPDGDQPVAEARGLFVVVDLEHFRP
ncbi:MAG: hypothetical protein JWM86_2423 [Thermoleophilia bacterium]|nr:hypothetical protein [Thermoleophilia bacterium]